MNKFTRTFLILGLCGIVVSYLAAARFHERYSLRTLHNTQVRWDGTYFGIMPFLSGKADAVVQANDAGFIPGLIRCLDNDDQYAAAHVALTMIACKTYNISGGTWNGLDVQLRDDRQIIPASCPPAIKKNWQQWQRTQSKSWFWLFD